MKKLFLIVVVCLFAINCVFAGDKDTRKLPDLKKLPDLEFIKISKRLQSEKSAYEIDQLVKDCLYSGKIRIYGVESPSVTYVIKDGRALVKEATNVNTNDIRLINCRIRMVAFPMWPVESFTTIYSMK